MAPELLLSSIVLGSLSPSSFRFLRHKLHSIFLVEVLRSIPLFFYLELPWDPNSRNALLCGSLRTLHSQSRSIILKHTDQPCWQAFETKTPWIPPNTLCPWFQVLEGRAISVDGRGTMYHGLGKWQSKASECHKVMWDSHPIPYLIYQSWYKILLSKCRFNQY